MKAIYIKDTVSLCLTKGRIYNVLSVEKGWYRIVDDSGEDYLYPPENFELVLQDTFDTEYKELLGWYVDEKNKIPDIRSGMLDGGSTLEQRALDAEYRKRLKALRKKYNIEQTP